MIKLQKYSLIAVLVLIPGVFSVFANEIDPQAVLERRAQLESELVELEKQIESQREIIRGKQAEATTFERDIAILNAQISKTQLEIKARNLSINKLNSGIGEKVNLIDGYVKKIGEEKISLAELLRRVDEMDATSLVEIILGYDSLSDFFADFSSFESIQKELQASLYDIKNTQVKTEEEKQYLEDKKREELSLRGVQEIEKRKLEKKEDEKQDLLDITKGEEEVYQKILNQKQKSAATIRSELFVLRGSDAIPFEKAVEHANAAFKVTGVRPAFILGVISYESELGANLGTGNWKDDLYECYKKIGYPTSAEKQKTAFLDIASELGLNPDVLPVSKAPYYGCGGAMGPAQFMPTTWQLYKDKVGQVTGHVPPSPWEPYDAFMAAALLLKDNGAAAGGHTAERRAALRYFAGGNWEKSSYAFYGDDVMELATKYQEQIDIISGN
ncbi:MAG: lytic murein transglycosylase [Patescibacteria group bacterium]